MLVTLAYCNDAHLFVGGHLKIAFGYRNNGWTHCLVLKFVGDELLKVLSGIPVSAEEEMTKRRERFKKELEHLKTTKNLQVLILEPLQVK